jgi:enoyl-CoA hydratase
VTNPIVRVERDGALACVTMNRPDALNALNRALRAALVTTFTELAEDNKTEVVIFTGAGRAFTAGLDLKELGGETQASSEADGAEIDIGAVLHRFPKPIIGAINGFAITGGFELALLCDILLCAEEAAFADTHARVGVVPGWGLSQRLPRLIGLPRAKELSLTGNFLSAQQAYAWGMVNRVVPKDELLPAAKALAKDILTTESVTRNAVLALMDAGWEDTLEGGLTREKTWSQAHMAERVQPEAVAERRRGIMNRGRGQSS